MREAIARTLSELEDQRRAQGEGGPGAAGGPRDRDKLMLAVGPDTGKLLNTLIQATSAKRVLEIGGSMGYSTIWQAEAVERNGGTLTTLEAVPSKVEILRRRVAQAGLEGTVTIVEGNALEVLPRLEGPFDLVLVDAWKADYPAYFELVFPKLAVGGLIVADNITRPAPPDAGITEYVEKARSPSPGAKPAPPGRQRSRAHGQGEIAGAARDVIRSIPRTPNARLPTWPRADSRARPEFE